MNIEKNIKICIKIGKLDWFKKYIKQINLLSKEYNNNHNGILEELYDLNLTVPTKDFIGIVRSYDKETKMAIIEQRNYFVPNSTIEVFTPTRTFNLEIGEIYDKDGVSLDAARHPLQEIHFKSDIELKPFDLLRLN